MKEWETWKEGVGRDSKREKDGMSLKFHGKGCLSNHGRGDSFPGGGRYLFMMGPLEV